MGRGSNSSLQGQLSEWAGAMLCRMGAQKSLFRPTLPRPKIASPTNKSFDHQTIRPTDTPSNTSGAIEAVEAVEVELTVSNKIVEVVDASNRHINILFKPNSASISF